MDINNKELFKLNQLKINKLVEDLNIQKMPHGKYEGELIIELPTQYLVHYLTTFVVPVHLRNALRIALIWRLDLDLVFNKYTELRLLAKRLLEEEDEEQKKYQRLISNIKVSEEVENG